jgi:Restriction endonuclease
MSGLDAIAGWVVIGIFFLLLTGSSLFRECRARSASRRRIEADKFRRENPVRIVGSPHPDHIANQIRALELFIQSANEYRPKLSIPTQWEFRDILFHIPLATFYVRYPELGEGPELEEGPEPHSWELTIESLAIPDGGNLHEWGLYLSSLSSFPCEEPSFEFFPPSRPRLPDLQQFAKPQFKVVFTADGTDVDPRVPALQQAYEPEFKRTEELEESTAGLYERYLLMVEKAKEAEDLIEIHLTHEALLFKQKKEKVFPEFLKCKQKYEEQFFEQTGLVSDIFSNYRTRSREGIEDYHSEGLMALALPIPPEFPWKVFYDPAERLLQVNQRVPALSDFVVKRSDSKRPPAKRDVDYVLRRIIPAISLHIARQVAKNDEMDDIDDIAINLWCRYFEKATGKLKNAFVASLNVRKSQILDINISKADALDAFRALRGAFIYSADEIAPIEPQVRLDKDDERFVEGREVMDGLPQGQNLATMDWQEFEHLIRELLAKEYGRKDGAEVRITRASRDRGVDAVIFDPDPLHGGKYVVQAKRYNNLVDVSAVRDLWGTVMNEGAARGILVTTSRYGRDAYEFASNKPLTLIDGQNLLSLLGKHGYSFKIEMQ